MKRFACACALGFCLVATGAATTAPLRVGTWELTARAAFSVAADPGGGDLHFVYSDRGRLHHAHSRDGGKTWSAPQYVASGYGHALAVDRTGTAHLVYEAEGSSRIAYRSQARDTWSPEQDIGARVPGHESQNLAPRVAVDGAGNVHVIFWTLWKAPDWKPGGRCAYRFKPAGRDGFDPPELWEHQQGQGHGRYGALAVDPAGHMHIFYASGRFNSHALERRIRHADGTWGRHDRWPGRLLTDWCIGAAVDQDGTAHVAVQTKVGDRLKVVYLNNRADPAALALQHELGWESYETYCQLLVAPNRDLWIATGHIEHKGGESSEPPDDLPNLGTFTHYRAATGAWSARSPVSPAGAINLDTRRSNEPRLLFHAGQVRLFYAEKLPDGKWRHWQRLLEAEPAPVR